VTLTGAGIGKTSGIKAGRPNISAQTDHRFTNGVHFVVLAPLETTEAIVPTIAAALGFSFYEGGEPRQQLLDYLREKSLLLIMDNFDHLLSSVVCWWILKPHRRPQILATHGLA
jgi:predicted ATPase